LKKARKFIESGTVNRSWHVFFASSGGRPATQPLRKWPAHSLPPQSVREMTEICLRINFYFSFFGPPPLPKSTQSINTHRFYSTYSQSHCNLTNLFTKPLQPNPKATQSINTHRFYSTYSQSHCNLTNLFTKPLQPTPQSNPKYQYPQILFNLFTKPLQLDQFIHKATAT
jgi:hypothetical protein